MASRAITAGARGPKPDWRAVLRRSLRRSAEIAGSLALLAAMVFLALALISYEQTDPSASTASSGPVLNWMGAPGAWFAERALYLFGVVSVLLLPMLYVFARKLWKLVEEDDAEQPHADHAWWRPIGVLLFAMALIGTPLALWFDGPGGSLPASLGGISGLLGAKTISALAGLAGETAQGWLQLTAAVLCLGAGAVLAGRVFALDWGSLLTLPGLLRRRPTQALEAGGQFISVRPAKPVKDQRTTLPPAEPTRKPPEITDPTRAARPAQLATAGKQGDFFDTYKLPELDLLTDPRPIPRRKSTSWRWSATRGCWKPCSTISTSKARLTRSGWGRW